MKNIFKFSIFAILVMVAPLSLAIAQEKKTEQKIKIITNDGSGKKVVIDTVFTGNGPESIKLKDGSVVYIDHDEDSDMKPGDGKHHVYVTSTSSDNKDGKITREITVINSDSEEIANNQGNVVLYSNKNINGQESDDTSTVYVEDSAADKSRYVIAKDGMVVTIEGSDEAKTKALAKEIEEKLGVNNKEKK